MTKTNLLYWAMYESFFLCFIIPSYVMGGLIINDRCLNDTVVPLFIWFFVYGGIYTLLNALTAPILYLIMYKRINFNEISLLYKITAITTLVVFTFTLGWLGFGGYLYSTINKCMSVHAPRLILSYVIVWSTILSAAVIAVIIALILYCILINV